MIQKAGANSFPTKANSNGFKKVSKVRKLRGSENQQKFWSPIGVTQSGGSRYETGRKIPNSVQFLLYFREQGIITNEMLEKAKKNIAKRKMFSE